MKVKSCKGTKVESGGPRTNLKSKVNAGQAEGTCEDCRFSREVSGLKEAMLICENKADAEDKCMVVEADEKCENFDDCGHTPSELAEALAEGAKLIPLTQDKVAIVDAEDYDRLSKYKWCVGRIPRTSYGKRSCKGGVVYMHRQLTSAPAHLVVDHINHNGLDNRKRNLRLCTRAENSRNSRTFRINGSKYKGVTWYKRRKHFIASIRHKGKFYNLGRFKSEIAAAKAYDRKAKEFFGEFAYLNFP